MSAIRLLPEANVRSPTYYVARTHVGCWHCGSSTGLLALAMPRNHETLDADILCDADADSDSDDCDNSKPNAWQRTNASAFVFYVEHLPLAVQNRLSQLSQRFRLGYSAATLNSYWANHCEHCGNLLGDHELHCEPDGAFMPSSEARATNIELLQIQEPFEAVAAGYAFEPEFFVFMRKSR
jgi:hypothetical protein